MWLVMTCVFTALWVRSQTIADTILFRQGEFTFQYLISVDQCLAWMQRKDQDVPEIEDTELEITYPKWEHFSPIINLPTSEPKIPPHRDAICYFSGKSFFISPSIEWKCNVGGIGRGSVQTLGFIGGTGRIEFVSLPYWSIVIPFTLISALLLFAKPCKSTRKKIPEPTANEGA